MRDMCRSFVAVRISDPDFRNVNDVHGNMYNTREDIMASRINAGGRAISQLLLDAVV